MLPNNIKFALVHDSLIQEGGAEKVLEALTEIFPNAPIFTLIHDKKKIKNLFSNSFINVSFLQNFPFSKRFYQWYLLLMPIAIESFDFSNYDIVISSSSSFAKGVITQSKTLHFCYCHTPTRYLWTDTHSYVKELSCPRLVKKIIPYFLSYLRLWDRLASERSDIMIANSETVKKRIKKYYNRESIVVWPPVEVDKFKISKSLGNYYLTGGRLVSYKKIDLVVKAFNKLNIPLKIFGAGPEEGELKKIAKSNIEFLGKISQEELARYYSSAIAFIHPQEEDFGITAVEAMASGRPVIAYKAGGATETVIEGVSGKFFDEQEWESLAEAVIRFKKNDYNPEKIKKHAENFSKNIFKEKIINLIENTWKIFKK